MSKCFSDSVEIFPSFGCSTYFLNRLQDAVASSLNTLSLPCSSPPLFVDQDSWHQWSRSLPLTFHSYIDKNPCTLRICFLYRFENTNGVDKHIAEVLSRWLLPGKRLSIEASYQCRFFFKKYPQKYFSLAEFFFLLHDSSSIRLIARNMNRVCEELKAHILSMYYTKQIFAEKHLSPEEKLEVMHRYLASVREKNRDSHSLEMLQQLSSEQTSFEIDKNIQAFVEGDLQQKEDLFYEVKRYMFLFPQCFTAKREIRHVSKILTFLHLSRAKIKRRQEKKPKERHILIQVLKTKVSYGQERKQVLGILVTLTLTSDLESFHRRHMIEALAYLAPNTAAVKDSYIIDRRSHDRIRAVYLELESNNRQDLDRSTIAVIQKQLPKEITRRLENVRHPIFMPRNDEELMRNIILLANELRYVRDLPQVIISYENQTSQELSFTIVIARLLKTPINKDPLFFENSPTMNISLEQKKIVGLLKNKYPKEASVFRIRMPKSSFFRQDYSLDLQKARRHVVSAIRQWLGEFRDFNGGMILKKTEAFDALRSEIRKIDAKQEFLLENFFYAIKPSVMQTILETHILTSFFQQVVVSVQKNLSEKKDSLVYQEEAPYFFVIVTTANASTKQRLLQSMKKGSFSPYDLVISSFSLYELSVIGFAYKYPSQGAKASLKKTVETILGSRQKKESILHE